MWSIFIVQANYSFRKLLAEQACSHSGSYRFRKALLEYQEIEPELHTAVLF
jgi:hypothetical protein